MAKMGRPTKYTEELGIKICELISEGQSLVKISKLDEMPSYSNLMVWLGKHPNFRDRYAIAKQECLELMAEKILEISDDNSNDLIHDKDGTIKSNGAAVSRSRLMVDARKWTLARLAPQKYGDRVQIEKVNSVDLKDKTDEELRDIINS